jgi:drug/metabolite transporter (DMT)-like permease
MNKKIFSAICALVTSFIWGSAFVAQDMGMDNIGPYTFNFSRLFVGFLGLIPFFFIFEFKKIKQTNLDLKKILKYFLILGFILGTGQALQQVSLLYTDVANSAVFTILYVILTPIVSLLVFSKEVHWSIWPSAIICFIGSLFLSEINNVTVRFGDSLVIISAFFWAFHMIYIAKTLEFFNFPITLAMTQSLFASLFAIIPALAFEELILSSIFKESYEILYVGLLSSSLAFLLQAYSLQNLSATAAAIIFSLEGVFAAILGWIILDQYLNEIKIFGIFLIVSAVIFSQLIPSYGKKKYE